MWLANKPVWGCMFSIFSNAVWLSPPMFWAKKIIRSVKLSGVDITFVANSVAHSTVYVPIGVVKKEV